MYQIELLYIIDSMSVSSPSTFIYIVQFSQSQKNPCKAAALLPQNFDILIYFADIFTKIRAVFLPKLW